MKKFLKNQNGMTIVEIMIYMGLLSIFLLILTDILAGILDVKSESMATSSVEQDSRFIVSRLIYDVNRASSIVSPLLGASSSSLVLNIEGSNNTYSISSSNLQLVNTFGTNIMNSTETTINSLSFQNIGNSASSKNPSPKSTVKVSFTITGKTRKNSGYEVRNISTTIGVR